MNAPYKTLVATFTGGFLGTLSMRALSPSFWWIGMIVGAVVGFIIKSEKEVRKEVSQCDFRLEPNVLWFCGQVFIPSVESMMMGLQNLIAVLCFLSGIFTLLGAIVYDVSTTYAVLSNLSLQPFVDSLKIMSPLQWFGCHVFVAVSFLFWEYSERNKRVFKPKGTLIAVTVFMCLVSPVSLIVMLPVFSILLIAVIVYHLVIWTVRMCKAIANAGTKIWNDTTYACATASALGACIGHYAGDNPLVGGGAGVVLALARIKIHEALGRVLSR